MLSESERGGCVISRAREVVVLSESVRGGSVLSMSERGGCVIRE